MTSACAHLDIGEGQFHVPMQAIFLAPLGTNGLGQALVVRWWTAEIEARLKARFAIDMAFKFDVRERF